MSYLTRWLRLLEMDAGASGHSFHLCDWHHPSPLRAIGTMQTLLSTALLLAVVAFASVQQREEPRGSAFSSSISSGNFEDAVWVFVAAHAHIGCVVRMHSSTGLRDRPIRTTLDDATPGSPENHCDRVEAEKLG